MFHGLMVALSFNKQVKFNQIDYVKNRSQTLLELLEIENTVKEFELNIDYKIVNEKLNKMRELSIDKLRKVL